MMNALWTFLLALQAGQATDPPKLPEGNFQARLNAASSSFLGRPYMSGPMGEGDGRLGDPAPRMRFDAFDCVTFIEESEALARTASKASLQGTLDSIRYRHGKVSWETRNHYMECGWLSNASEAGRLRLLDLPGSINETRLLELHKFYGSHGIERRDTSLMLRYLPRDRAIRWLSDPQNAPRIRGIGFVARTPHLFIHHVGFLIPHDGGPWLRHASQSGKVRQELAAAYLRGKPKFIGIIVWEYLPAR